MGKTIADWEDELSDLRALIATCEEEVRHSAAVLADYSYVPSEESYQAYDEAFAERARMLRLYDSRKARYKAWLTRRVAREELQAVRES